jgi:hypothetical protein
MHFAKEGLRCSELPENSHCCGFCGPVGHLQELLVDGSLGEAVILALFSLTVGKHSWGLITPSASGLSGLSSQVGPPAPEHASCPS